MGAGIQPDSDVINFGTDTFHVSTDTLMVDYIYAKPDSFLLGNFNSPRFGSTKASILAQVKHPEDFVFPPNSVADSAKLVIIYYSWFGDQNSPIEINVYQMDGTTPLNISTPYRSNVNLDDYVDYSKHMASGVFKAKDTDRNDSTAIVFDLPQEYVFPADSKIFAGKDTFLTVFPGMFITTEFGSSTMLHIGSIYIQYYYHYTYQLNGKDTTANMSFGFHANSEVRQINHLNLYNRDVVQPTPDVSYIASPANVYTEVNIPLQRMKERMTEGVNGKKLYLNSATIDVVVDQSSATGELELSRPSNLMIIKEDAFYRMQTDDKIPVSSMDTCATYAALTYKVVDSDTTYYYPFNLSALVANELKVNETPAENLKLLVMPFTPVYTTTSSTSYISGAKPMLQMSGVSVKGGTNTNPMRVKVVYSGF